MDPCCWFVLACFPHHYCVGSVHLGMAMFLYTLWKTYMWWITTRKRHIGWEETVGQSKYDSKSMDRFFEMSRKFGITTRRANYYTWITSFIVYAYCELGRRILFFSRSTWHTCHTKPFFTKRFHIYKQYYHHHHQHQEQYRQHKLAALPFRFVSFTKFWYVRCGAVWYVGG